MLTWYDIVKIKRRCWWYSIKGFYWRKIEKPFLRLICFIRGYHREGQPRIQFPTFGMVGKNLDEEIYREDGKIVEFISCKDCFTLIRKQKVNSIKIGSGEVIK